MSKPTFAELLAAKQAELAAKQSTPASGLPASILDESTPAPAKERPANPFLARMAAAKAAPATPSSSPSTSPSSAVVEKAAENLLRQVDDKAKVSDADLREVVTAIPKVELSAKTIAMSNAVVAAGSVADDITSGDDLDLIKDRIERLQSVDGFELKTAMDGLKSLILANPAACAQLLPEDIGEMVTALRRMTGNKEAAAMAAPARRKAAKEPALDANALEDLMNDLALT